MDELAEITDPSLELARLGRQFRSASISKSGQTIHTALSEIIGIDKGSIELFDVLGAIVKRAYAVQRLANTIQDSGLRKELRTQVVDATKAYLRIFQLGQMHQPWEPHRDQAFAEAHLTALGWFSSSVQRTHALRILTNEQRDVLIEKIEDTLGSIANDQAIPEWSKLPLTDGLERLRLILKYFAFFGHEAALMHLLHLRETITAIDEEIATNTEQSMGGVTSISDAASLIVSFGNMLALPENANSLFQADETWAVKAVSQIPNLPYSRPLLSPPSDKKP